MAFIKKYTHTIGEYIITTKEHKNCAGTMEIGTEVQIMDITPRGYDIQDAEGNLVTEIGWII